jgi:TolB-like protein/Tfp pilus assembly protein PilF
MREQNPWERAMGEQSPGTLPTVKTPEDQLKDRLDSWKEIATYLNRDVTTVQRWEKREGMPVHRHLHDKRGSVYALTEEVDLWMRGRRLSEADPENEPEAETPPVEQSPKTAETPRRAGLWLALAAALCVCSLVAAWLMLQHRRVAAVQPKIRSLAVLPLKNLSGDPAQEYFADDMTEEVIGRLSMIHGLRVISRTSVMQFKDTKLLAPEIAKTLGADALVEGSVIREGNRIRVHAQLIRAATDEHFWSETYDRDLSDVLALQSNVAQAIAEKVEVSLSNEEHSRLVAARQVSPEVYESYLKGRSVVLNTQADGQRSVGYFEEAIKKDPSFAPAYAGLANAYFEVGTPAGGVPPRSVRQKLIDAAHKASELDPTLVEPHVLLGFAYQGEWEWDSAEREFNAALELSPNDAWAHRGYAEWLLCRGRTEEAQAWARQGRDLDPFSVTGHDLGWILFQSRRYDEAIRELRSDLAVHPDAPADLWFLGFALIAKGASGDAIPVMERAVDISDRSPVIIGTLVQAYAHAGHQAQAMRLVEELKRRQQKGYIPADAFVNAYLGLGDKEQAFAWMERAYKEQSMILQYLKVYPFFDPVRDDPRFQDLVRRVGLN